MAASELLTLLGQIAKAAERQDRAALNRLIKAYGTLYRRLAPRVDLIAERAARDALTPAQVARMSELDALRRATAAELQDFSGVLASELTAGTAAAAALGANHAAALLRAAIAGTPAAGARVHRVTPDALDVMLEWTRPGGKLRGKIDALAPFHAQRVADALVEAIAAGRNPKAVAAGLQDIFGGGLTDALRMTRTAQLYAYRQATQQSYAANGVEGWTWFAQLDDRTCLSCVSMHGTTHPADEILNDHHNGRCAMVPIVAGQSFVQQTGPDWFDMLPETNKRAMMPAAVYELYRAGQLDFAQLSTTRPDDVYGPMRVETSVKDILGTD